jgi:hypothetical protein
VNAAKGGFEPKQTIDSARTATGIKPKAQGERLPVPAGWRFGGRVLRSFGAMTWLG